MTSNSKQDGRKGGNQFECFFNTVKKDLLLGLDQVY